MPGQASPAVGRKGLVVLRGASCRGAWLSGAALGLLWVAGPLAALDLTWFPSQGRGQGDRHRHWERVFRSVEQPPQAEAVPLAPGHCCPCKEAGVGGGTRGLGRQTLGIVTPKDTMPLALWRAAARAVCILKRPGGSRRLIRSL